MKVSGSFGTLLHCGKNKERKKRGRNAAGSEGKKGSSIPKTFQTGSDSLFFGEGDVSKFFSLGVRRAERVFSPPLLLCGAALQFLTVKNARKAAVPSVTGIRKNLQMALCADKRPRVTTG